MKAVIEEVRRDIIAILGRDPGSSRVVFTRERPGILGFVEIGRNVIYINEVPFKRIYMEKGADAAYQYIYVIAMHEYLHMLGILDEREVRRITLDIIERKFGSSSFAYVVASKLADPRDLFLKKILRDAPPYIT